MALIKIRHEYIFKNTKDGHCNDKRIQKFQRAAAVATLRTGSPHPTLLIAKDGGINISAIGVFKKHIRAHPSVIDSMSENELAALITHELAHFKHHDNLKMLLAPLLLGVPAIILMQSFSVAYIVRDLSTHFLWIHAVIFTIIIMVAHYALSISGLKAIASRNETHADHHTRKHYGATIMRGLEEKMRTLARSL
ncbi:M48 family metalloprotease [Hyphococcus flavus]|uniref:M48 family metalloprotease n=1 Tax=Hyphococcus flavus TaxID=1866326 RepID=A0AAF0CEV9_9PROT|nr:M48 family metalloprotease [Hyphococcus flavus]WDI30148.1 M48 family metalloprotease [Hyphococcus flavus]